MAESKSLSLVGGAVARFEVFIYKPVGMFIRPQGRGVKRNSMHRWFDHYFLGLTCNYLVAYSKFMGARVQPIPRTPDLVFKALADAGRRRLLDRLRMKAGLALGELCDGMEMSRQGVTKHLALLEEAGLVVALKKGREKLHYLNPVPVHEIAERWIRPFERCRLDALRDL